MSTSKFLSRSLAVALCVTSFGFASQNPDAMRGANAVQVNSKLAQSLTLTKDAQNNTISLHVNGVNPKDAEILLKQEATPLSTEYTIITGQCREGTNCYYMIPTNVATPQVVEGISKELVNGGSIAIQITKTLTGDYKAKPESKTTL